MKTFEAGCKAYHAANSELEAHYGSEQGNRRMELQLKLTLLLSHLLTLQSHLLFMATLLRSVVTAASATTAHGYSSLICSE